MNKWNAVGFLVTTALVLGFFAVASDNLPMKIIGFVFAGLNFVIAVAGAVKR
jgi:hypothetical protein